MKRNPIPAAALLGFHVLYLLGPAALAAAPDFWEEIPLSPSTTMPSQILDDYWNGEFQRVNREVSQAKETRMVFFGDSITWYWSLGNGVGRDVWNEQYSRYQPINMGNSGDITPVMLYRAAHGNLDFPKERQPKVAVLLCGILNQKISQYTQAHSTPQQPMMEAAPDEGFDVTGDLADDGVLPNASGAEKLAEAYAVAIHRLASEVKH